MHWLDIVIIVMLVLPMVLGFRRGLIGTLAPLAGIILGIFLAGRFYAPIADWLSNWLHSPSQARIAAFALVFLLVIVATLLVSSLLTRLLSMLLLGWINRIGGLVLGLVIGALVSGAGLTLAAKFFPSTVQDTFQASALAAFFLDKFPLVLYLLPDEFEAVRQFFT